LPPRKPARSNPKKGKSEGSLPPVKLSELGIDKNLSARPQKRASISEQAFENMIEGTVASK
jgi:hypothetical protein